MISVAVNDLDLIKKATYIADKALEQTTGFLITIFNIQVPSFILFVIAATADNVLIVSSQLVLNTMWSFTLNELYPRNSAFCANERIYFLQRKSFSLLLNPITGIWTLNAICFIIIYRYINEICHKNIVCEPKNTKSECSINLSSDSYHCLTFRRWSDFWILLNYLHIKI